MFSLAFCLLLKIPLSTCFPHVKPFHPLSVLQDCLYSHQHLLYLFQTLYTSPFLTSPHTCVSLTSQLAHVICELIGLLSLSALESVDYVIIK